MSASLRSAEAMENAVVTATQGHVFSMEQGRLAHLDGRISSREAQSIRTVSESGSGQARSQQPAGAGGTPT